MGDSVTNGTIFDLDSGGESLKHFPRPVTIAAAVCAIIFSIVGVAGKIQFLQLYTWNELNFIKTLVSYRDHGCTSFCHKITKWKVATKSQNSFENENN